MKEPSPRSHRTGRGGRHHSAVVRRGARGSAARPRARAEGGRPLEGDGSLRDRSIAPPGGAGRTTRGACRSGGTRTPCNRTRRCAAARAAPRRTARRPPRRARRAFVAVAPFVRRPRVGYHSRPTVFFEQLELPLGGLYPQTEPTRIPRTRRVFVNRNLKLAGIDWVGFDMDYTLAIYNQTEMDNLSIQGTIAKLAARGYPEELLRRLRYPIHFPIRGLLIDKRFGHVLKMDRFKVVQRGLPRPARAHEGRAPGALPAPQDPPEHGPLPLDRHALRAERGHALRRHRRRPGGARRSRSTTRRLFTDIRECIDEAHRDGTILDVVLSDLPRFVERDPNLAQTLHKFRSAGKKLFLLTNSRWPFTEKMMTYLLGGRDARVPELPALLRRDRRRRAKPAFFQERRPLLMRDGDELRPAHGAARARRHLRGRQPQRLREVPEHLRRSRPLRRRSHLRRHPPLQEGERVAHGDDHPGDGGRRSPAHESCRRRAHGERALLEARRESSRTSCATTSSATRT